MESTDNRETGHHSKSEKNPRSVSKHARLTFTRQVICYIFLGMTDGGDTPQSPLSQKLPLAAEASWWHFPVMELLLEPAGNTHQYALTAVA